MRRYLLLMILSASSVVAAQEGYMVADETVGVVCSDDMKARVDNYFVHLNNHPSATGFIIGTANKNIEGQYAHYEDAIRKAIKFRKYPVERVKFLRTTDGNDMIFRYIIVFGDNTPPTYGELYMERPISAVSLYDKSEINSFSKKQIFLGAKMSRVITD